MADIGPHYEACVVADLRAEAARVAAKVGRSGRRKRRARTAAAADSNDKNLEKTHICDACGRTFRSGSELKTHYR